MPSINLNHEYPEINQADANALAIGAINGILQSDGANNFSAATIDNTPTENSTNLVESGGVFSAIASAASGKADKVAGATAGNLAGLDGSGNLTDAGIAAADVATKADVQNITPKRTASNDPANSSFSVLCDTALNGEAKPKLYGKSAVINQLVAISQLAPTTATWRDNGDGSVTLLSAASSDTFKTMSTRNSVVAGHVYYVGGNLNVYDTTLIGASGLFNTIFTALGTGTIATERVYAPSGTAANTTYWPQLIDLTAIFGTSAPSTVADLKTAWLKKFGYPLPQYIPYNAGSIVSNNATYQMHGRNLWDEEWELGGLDTSGQPTGTTNQIRSSFVPIQAGKSYYISWGANYPYSRTCVYDANKQFLSTVSPGGGGGVFTAPSGAAFFRFALTSNYGATYKNDICINLSDASFNGTYEAWYDGGSVTADSLNGIGTAMDEQDADGNITRKCASDVIDGTDDTITIGETSSFYYFEINNGAYDVLAWQTTGLIVNEGATEETAVAGVQQRLYVQFNANKGVRIRSDKSAENPFSSVESLRSFLGQNPLEIVYKTVTPTTSTTSPSDLFTQAGYNCLEPVSGDVQSADAECEYGVDIIAYIDKKLAEL